MSSPTESRSQIGTEFVVQHLLNYQPLGTYVEVGCADPEHLSATWFFYQKGWRGICIDALDRSERWQHVRPEDKFIKAVVGARGKTEFHRFSSDLIGTTREDYCEDNIKAGYAYLETTEEEKVPLSELVKDLKEIDLLLVDAEGMDLEVLQSYDWVLRPKIVVVEEYHFYEKRKIPEIGEWLATKGYRKIADVLIDGIYAREDIYHNFLR
jgi:hypothetical protein